MEFVGCMACGQNVPVALIQNSICPKCGQDVREVPVFPTVETTSKPPGAQFSEPPRITISSNELNGPRSARPVLTQQHSSCPYCKTEVVDDGSLAGKIVACPSCGNRFEMPVPKAQPASTHSFAAHQQMPPAQQTGYQQSAVYIHADPKNSGIAAVRSFFWCGLGQIYNGEIGKGILIILLSIVFFVLCFVACIGVPFMLFLWIWGICDAYAVAEGINRRSRGNHY